MYHSVKWTGASFNRMEAISSISAQIHHMQESYERVRKCAKVKGHVELKIDQTQTKRPLVTISPNYTIPTPTISVLTSTYTQTKKKVKVIERSRDVTPRSKYEKSKGHPSSPYASNSVQFRLLFTKSRYFEKNCHMPFFFDRPPS